MQNQRNIADNNQTTNSITADELNSSFRVKILRAFTVNCSNEHVGNREFPHVKDCSDFHADVK